MKFSPNAVRCSLSSPWGAMTLAAHDSALLWVGFDGQKHQPDLCAWPLSNAHPVLQGACTQLQQYFASERRTFDLPCDVSAGTPFQQRVWHSLQSIASGSTRSYASIALASGQPRAVRAVGGAIGRNPISIIIPCHRVVGSNGTLTGYAGGIDRKIALLQLESPI